MSTERKARCSRYGLVLWALLNFAGACSSDSVSSSVDDSEITIDGSSPEAVGTDQFGCPVVVPSRWVLTGEEYAEFCGEGCEAWDAILRGSNEAWFVACVAEELLSPPGEPALDVTMCVQSPVDGQQYLASDSLAAGPLFRSCWPPCAPDDPNSADLEPRQVLPDYCFD